MIYNKLVFFLNLTLVAGLFSCTVYKPVVSPSTSGQPAEDYISMYKDISISEMKRSGVPASITLAQGMIESDFGRSTLARDANNHFGIKCHSDWKGQTVRHHDDSRNECFRKYRKPEESFYDHSDFLTSGSRYRFLFDLDNHDYKAWARGLKKAGYATNPDYANMLIRKIEENNLWYYDQVGISSGSSASKDVASSGSAAGSAKISGGNTVPQTVDSEMVVSRVVRVMETNRIQYIIVKDGDTKEKLDSELNLLKWELAKYNELDNDFIPVPGQILYLQPKRDKAEPGKDTHTVVEGDSMYLISQRYGIKQKSLYELNRMAAGNEPEVGSKLWLRTMKPVN